MSKLLTSLLPTNRSSITPSHTSMLLSPSASVICMSDVCTSKTSLNDTNSQTSTHRRIIYDRNVISSRPMPPPVVNKVIRGFEFSGVQDSLSTIDLKFFTSISEVGVSQQPYPKLLSRGIWIVPHLFKCFQDGGWFLLFRKIGSYHLACQSSHHSRFPERDYT